MILSLLFAAAAAAASPHPEDLQVYSDWTVGCDNGRACQAVALMPEDMPDGAATMVVRRDAEAGAAPEIELSLEGAAGASLEADGRRLPVRLAGDGSGQRVPAADVPALVAALRTAKTLRIVGRGGASLGTVSLAGASAALLYMDDRQKRVGTVTALVRPGSKPAASVPPPPPVPAVRAVPVPRAAPAPIGAARIAALRKERGCTIDEVGGPDEVETHAIGANQVLILMACGSGAYNVTYIPFVATTAGGRVRIAPAAFDYDPGWAEGEGPALVNADWDAHKGLLGSYAKGRGLGDCGVISEHAWDGARFRLVELSEMGECRGAIDYITTWRARVAR